MAAVGPGGPPSPSGAAPWPWPRPGRRPTPTPTAPPPLTILTNGITIGGGDYFITPTGDTGTYANGPEIVNSSDEVIWFHAIPVGQTARRLQDPGTYHGRDRADLVAGHRLRWAVQRNATYIYNTRYQTDRHGQCRKR